ncbi:Ig-like domain-containing protein [bacterium]|nr:Ig-like domain-containing protein [bacterium]
MIGQNLSGANKIRIVRSYDGIDFTIACTTGIFTNSNGQSSATSLEIFVPKSLFDPDGTYVDSCTNDVAVLPLLPGVYSFIVERNDGLKSNAGSGEFYFAENLTPGGLNISILSSIASNITTLRAKLTSSNPDGIFGIKQISFSLLNSEPLTLTIPREGPVGVVQSRTLTEIHFDIPAGSLRGNKDHLDAGGTILSKNQYTINALNSKGWGTPVGSKFFMLESEVNITAIAPNTAVNFVETVVNVEGSSLFGIGKNVPVQVATSFADSAGVNSFILIHKESFDSDLLTTLSIDLTSTVTFQTASSFQFKVPSELRPGKWFMLASNDHRYSEGGTNPKSYQGFQNLLFDVVSSSPVVTSVTPILSTFDELPTTMVLTGLSLSGIRTAQLELLDSSTLFSEILTLTSAPDFTDSTYGSVSFTLPQSPFYLIPGDYQIHLGDGTEDVLVPIGNFKLTIEEKAPILNQIVPSIIDNHSDVSIQLLGDNLFGNPKITITNGVDNIQIETSFLEMSVSQLQNLTIPKSLFPQDWVLSIENSKGSTSMSFVITERIAIISSVVPNQVPFNARTPITIHGDHFISAFSSLGSLRLTDELQTALEEIQIISRNEIKAVIPEGIQLGKYELQLSNKGGINSTSAKITIEGGGLNLVSITPNAGMSTGNDFIKVTGSGFVQGSKLVIGGLLAWNVLAQEGSLEAFTPRVSASEDMSGGSTTVSVYVVNPDGAQSNSLNFTYLQEANQLPRIIAVYPGAMDVDTVGGGALNTKIAFKFSEAMNFASLSTEVDLVNNFKAVSSFKDAAPMAGVIRSNSRSDVFVFEPVPGNNYQTNKRASIGFSSEIKSAQDENLIANVGEVIQSNSIYFDLNTFIEDWGFIPTDTSLDNSALSIISPNSVSANVDLSKEIIIEFSTYVNPLTIWENDFVLRDMTASKILEISIEVDDGGKIVHVNPQQLLLPSHTYQLQVKSVRLESLTSNSMSSDRFLQLNTVESGPQVIQTIPVNEAINIAVNSNYIVKFNQSIDPVTITSSNLIVSDYLDEVLRWTYELDETRKWLTLTFDETLTPDQYVDVELSRRIKSLVGIPMSFETTTRFKVSSDAEADLSEPVVRLINPSNFATNVSTDATIIVSYSEDIHPVDVNQENFTIKKLVNNLEQDFTYTVTLDSNQRTVYLSAINDLSYDATYRVTAKLGVRDLFGNRSTISVGTEFTVTSFFDNFGPGLNLVNPSDGEEGVSITTTIVLIFDENLSPSTVVEDNFRLIHLSNFDVSLPKDQLIGTTLPAAINLVTDTQVQISSVSALEKATYYMIEFTSDVKDQFGNQATPFRSVFKTEVRVDNTPPVITLLTVNDLPHHLNGDGNTVGSVNPLIPLIEVNGQGFTIDIYYEDPLIDGYAAGVDVSTLRVLTEKPVTGLANNENLVSKATQFGHVVHEAGHTRLYFPRGGALTFSQGLHTLSASIQDFPDPLTNNDSSPASFAFHVETKNPVFIQDKLFYLDFSGDYFIQTPDVKLGGELTIRTEFKNPPANGINDFDRDLMIMGLTIDPNSDQFVDIQRNIAYGVRTLVQAEILKESRKLFDLDPETGVPINSLEAMHVRLTTNPTDNISGLRSVIRIGGDNGQELDTTSTPNKTWDRGFYSSVNQDAQLDLTARTTDRNSSLGVFPTHMIRKFANDVSVSSDWNVKFGSLAPLGFSGSAGQSGQAIGTFFEDEHILQFWHLEESEITSQMMGEFHKARFGKMKLAIRSFAKMVAVGVVRVAALGTGAHAIGIPSQGYFGGTIDSSFFIASQTEGYYLQPLLSNGQADNNLLRKDVDYFSIFNQVHFSSLAKNYLQNRVLVSPQAQGTIPGQIVNVAASAGDGVANLTWSSSLESTQYNVYYGLNEQINKSNFLGKQTFSNNSGTITGLDNGTTYFFFVTGQNSQGEGPESAIVSAAISGASLFKISSTQMQSDTEMPSLYTCSSLSPPLSFEGAPEDTLSMVLIVKNTSTANSIWSAYNFAKSSTGSNQGAMPNGAVLGKNGATGSIGYEGPCPSTGTTQFVDFELYAVDISLLLLTGATELEIRQAMNLHIIAQDTTSLSNVKITK